MNPFIDRQARKAATLWVSAIMMAFVSAISSERSYAQQWEYIYGHPIRIEDGKFRVVPVTGSCASPSCCPQTDGYIAVGSSAPGLNDPQLSDVHVVRTDNTGARIWENTYDITGGNDHDAAWSVIELTDGTGFVITGETSYTGTNDQDLFLLKINCNGAVVWSRTYGAFNVVDGGRDLIEAATGNAAAGTSAGDIVVAGYTLGPGPFAGSPDGYLLRVTTNGAVIWDRVYDYQPMSPPGNHDYFYSLTEATPVGAAPTGDIIAVGSTTPNGSNPAQDGLAVRVNGDNGTIGLAPQGVGKFGIPLGPDALHSVIELQNPNEIGAGGRPNVVLCGYFNHQWIDLIKLNGGDPCTVLTDRVIKSATVNDYMQGRTLREIAFAPGTGSVAQWDLVLTGIYGTAAAGTTQAFLLSVAPGNLAPGALAKHYGGNGNEEGWSLFPVDAVGGRTFGFVICGHTTTNWGSGNSWNMYLLKTDGFGATGCENNLSVADSNTTRYNCITVLEDNIGLSAVRIPSRTSRRWETRICSLLRPGAAPEGSLDIGLSQSGPQE